VLLHVVDASHPEWEDQMRVVEEVLDELDLSEKPVIPVFNKIDLLVDAVGVAARAQHENPDSVLTTTMRTDGLAALKKSLRALARKERPVVIVRVPTADGARLAEMYRVGEVLDRRSEDGTEELTIRLEDWQAERLEREGVEVRREDDRQRSRATG